MDNFKDNHYFICKHCNDKIAMLDEVSKHACFKDKNVYLEENNILFSMNEEYTNEIDTNEVENEVCSFQNSLNDDDSCMKQRAKQNIIWDKKSTLTLLSLYEANLHLMENSRKKMQVWNKISLGLKEYNINVSSEQVKWKINSVTRKYKECIDNNTKSGRALMTFEYFNEMDNILCLSKEGLSTYTISTKLPSTSSTNSKKSSLNNNEEFQNNFNTSSVSTINLKENTKRTRVCKINEPTPTTSTGQSTSTIDFLNTNKKIKKHTKYNVNESWLEFMDEEKLRREESLKSKNKIVELKQDQLFIREKELKLKKTLEKQKLKSKERRHDELLKMEKWKCKLLQKLTEEKENAVEYFDSDID